jgi:histidinol dehydrogenase
VEGDRPLKKMIKTIRYPERSEWARLLARPQFETLELESKIIPILTAIKKEGDKALLRYTEQFDGARIEKLLVSETEFENAEGFISQRLKASINIARINIEKFHIAQREPVRKIETMPGVTCWRKSVPISKVGLYIPGGTAPLFSTILMLGIPAIIAGCEEIILCTPPDKKGNIHPAILYTANLLGIKKVYKAGGAQAIGAMAYGTESIPAVYKIFGPGNQYVTAAKRLVTRDGIAIDMPAGPSEVAVVGDKSCIPAFVAADLLSQAEHGTDSQVVFISDSEETIQKVLLEIMLQAEQLTRKEIIYKALEYSKCILVKTMAEAIAMVNEYAPEHLILQTGNAENLASRVVNAGSVFIGNYTPEAAGDYASGTNHTLPTNGYAKAYSGVSLDSFVKKITYQHISKEGMAHIGPVIEIMAENEQLTAHKNAVSIRLNALSEHRQ